MKTRVLIALSLTVLLPEPALACTELTKDQAGAALYLLQGQSHVVRKCVDCPEDKRELVKVGTVTLAPAGAQKWAVHLNGKPVNVEEVYLRMDPSTAVSLAHLVRCQFPTVLPAMISMKADQQRAAGDAVPLPKDVTVEKVHHVNAEYPLVARQSRIQGKVVLDAIIEKDGSVSDVRIVESPHPMLDEPSIAAVQQWRYKPVLIDGVPTRVRVRVTTTFALK